MQGKPLRESTRVRRGRTFERTAAILGLACAAFGAADPIDSPTLNTKADGYRGIWYANQPSRDEYVYKYSGGLGTYCAKHQPFAVYRPEVDKTFFCYGGTAAEGQRRLVHMVSYYDHQTGQVPRPTVLLDKRTDDAHDNPVMAMDDRGFVWIFSTSHGTARPSCIHRSERPYDIDAFERVDATRDREGMPVPIDNFSYMQAWHVSDQGFACFFTRYKYPVARTICYMSSPDGKQWSEWRRLAAFGEGHYQISAATPSRAGAAFNYHPPKKGLNWRSNLYYLETRDFGRTWQTAAGERLELPLTEADNPALALETESAGKRVYLKDMDYDQAGRPIILFIVSGGYEAGPKNDPRQWTTARWTGEAWEIKPAMRSDNNYDMGSLYLGEGGEWRVIAPTETGPQPYNPGGEAALWTSGDRGETWELTKRLTAASPYNHTYCRRPVNAHPDFVALWADGHGRRPSPSALYVCDRQGNVRRLPTRMDQDFATPELIPPGRAARP